MNRKFNEDKNHITQIISVIPFNYIKTILRKATKCE